MKNTNILIECIFLFYILSIGSVSASYIFTDKNEYNFEENVTIYGREFPRNLELTVDIVNPDHSEIRQIDVTTDDEGNFTTKYSIPAQSEYRGIIEGNYTVTAAIQEENPNTIFTVSTVASTTTTTVSTTTSSTTTTTIINSINYIEVNGTVFIQPEAINITGWSGNLSSETYLWNNYTGAIQSMPPNGTGVQTNITLSSNLNLGVYRVSCNSTGNSTLVSKSFTVATASATTTIQDDDDNNNNNNQGTTTTTIPETTTTITITSSTTSITSTNASSTTITIPEEETKGKKTWYVIPIILVFVLVGIVLWYLNYMKKPAESTEFEKIKEKWSQ